MSRRGELHAVILLLAGGTLLKLALTGEYVRYVRAGLRPVLLAPAASDGGARGDYVWWSTGDNETLAWHALDLRSLTG